MDMDKNVNFDMFTHITDSPRGFCATCWHLFDLPSCHEAELKLDQRQTKSVVLEKRAAALERSLSKEESSARSVEAQLGQAHRDQQHVEMELKAATARVAALEKSNTTLLGEKCAHAQVSFHLPFTCFFHQHMPHTTLLLSHFAPWYLQGDDRSAGSYGTAE